MGFSRVRFNNFRNLSTDEIKFSPGLNLITGANGSGKTNLLEGINIISGWGPLERGTRQASLPTWNSGSEEVRLTGQLDTDGEIIQVKFSGRVVIKIDDKTISATDLRWKIPVLTFLPNDMAILEGSASYRRRLLDMLLALIVPPYAMRLSDYRRGVRQKTAALRKGYDTYLIDKALMPLSVWIWKMREEAVSLLSSCMLNMGSLLPESLKICLKRGGSGNFVDFEEDYIRSLSALAERERAVKCPLVGPHRDDLIITCKNRLAQDALSRGYRRRAAVSLMLAASDGVKRKLGKEPVLLLDEVTAELDSDGKKFLFDTLIERKTQVFAATAEPFSDVFPCSVYRVSNGGVTKIYEN